MLYADLSLTIASYYSDISKSNVESANPTFEFMKVEINVVHESLAQKSTNFCCTIRSE